LYSALDPDTAYREANQDFFRTFNAPGGGGQALADAGGLRPDPLAVIGIHISVSRLLDLENVSVRQQLGIAADAELLVPWKYVPNPTTTQDLGSAVFADAFFEGLLYPSAQCPGRRCLVVFPTRLPGASRIHFQGFAFSTPRPHTAIADARLP
jgi:RES domain-containing protein